MAFKRKIGLSRHAALERDVNPFTDEGCLHNLVHVFQRSGYAPRQESQVLGISLDIWFAAFQRKKELLHVRLEFYCWNKEEQ